MISNVNEAILNMAAAIFSSILMMVSCQKKSPGDRPGLYIVLYFKTYSSRLLLIIVKVTEQICVVDLHFSLCYFKYTVIIQKVKS